MILFFTKSKFQGSNKREAEDATPWSVMVQQVRAATGGGIEDEEEDFMVEEPESGSKKEKEDMVLGSDDDSGVENEDVDLNVDTSLLDQSDSEDEEMPDILRVSDGEGAGVKRPAPTLLTSDEPKKKKRKKSQKCKVCGEKGHWKKDCEKLPEERRKELQELNTMKIERKGKGTGRKKSKNKLADILSGENKEPGEENDINGKDKKKSNKSKKKNNKFNKKDLVNQKDRSGASIEEGEALFQGFRVTKNDQERLKKLHKELRSSGATKEEVDFALKRERRKAEKTLARSKKLVCFNCREPGHMLADCPHTESVKVEAMPTAAGHCFKCGSLEHTSKDCKSKLKRENAYRFAVCFICKQEGHLAKACPDNPKGLYPNGGGCVFCGSVEHLKRDCPRKAEKDRRQGVKVGMMNGAGLEEEEDSHVSVFRKKKSTINIPKKVVAF